MDIAVWSAVSLLDAHLHFYSLGTCFYLKAAYKLGSAYKPVTLTGAVFTSFHILLQVEQRWVYFREKRKLSFKWLLPKTGACDRGADMANKKILASTNKQTNKQNNFTTKTLVWFNCLVFNSVSSNDKKTKGKKTVFLNKMQLLHFLPTKEAKLIYVDSQDRGLLIHGSAYLGKKLKQSKVNDQK